MCQAIGNVFRLIIVGATILAVSFHDVFYCRFVCFQIYTISVC